MSAKNVTPILPSRVRDIDAALNDARRTLFQAMGIVRLASDAIREPTYDRASTDAWTSLDAAHTILSNVADRLQDSETLLAAEVRQNEY